MIEPTGPSTGGRPRCRDPAARHRPVSPLAAFPHGGGSGARGWRGAPSAGGSCALWPLRPHRQQRSFLHRHVRRRLWLLKPPAPLALMLLAALVALSAAGSAARDPGEGAEGVGRWEQPLGRCRLERLRPAPQRLGCRTLRVNQQLPGLLSLRFLAADAGPIKGVGQLVLAGVLEPGSQPLQCQRMRCRPAGALRLRVSAMAASGGPQKPMASSLPRSQPAQGRCELQAKRFWCQAQGADGEEWQVEAEP